MFLVVLAEGIEERAVERTKKETINNVIVNMYKKGYTLNQIANAVGISMDDVKSVVTEKSPAMA